MLYLARQHFADQVRLGNNCGKNAVSLERTDFNRWRGNVRLFGCRHNFRHRLAAFSQYNLVARLNLLDQFSEPAGKLIDFRSFSHRLKNNRYFGIVEPYLSTAPSCDTMENIRK